MTEQEEVKRVKVSKFEARNVYGTGGKIVVKYMFESSDGRDIPKEASFRFIDCGYDFDFILNIYKMSRIKNVEYFVEREDLEAKQLCDLMCN